MPTPINATYLNQQVARVFAILTAAGAWDAAPAALQCSDFDYVLLYVSYIEGAVAGGAVDIKIEVSPDLLGTVWHQGTAYSTGAVVAGADTVSNFQREEISYDPTGVVREYFVFGPVALNGTAERIRVVAQESGQVGTPGMCEIEARFQ